MIKIHLTREECLQIVRAAKQFNDINFGCMIVGRFEQASISSGIVVFENKGELAYFIASLETTSITAAPNYLQLYAIFRLRLK